MRLVILVIKDVFVDLAQCAVSDDLALEVDLAKTELATGDVTFLVLEFTDISMRRVLINQNFVTHIYPLLSSLRRRTGMLPACAAARSGETPAAACADRHRYRS